MSAAVRFSPVRLAALVGAGLLAIGASLALGGALGAQRIDLREALSLPGSLDAELLFGLRLPRLALALIVGAGLSAAGAAYQGLLRNPLADPFVLGVSGGAALGGTLAIAASELLARAGVPFPEGLAVGPSAFVGALLATLLSFAGGVRHGRLDPLRTLLVGVIFNAFAASLITLAKTAIAPERAQELLFWLTGALGHEKGSTLALAAAATALSIGVLFVAAPRVNLLALGDDTARSLGVPVTATRALVFVAASLAVAVAVSLTGLVAFVGLLVPHVARLVLGPDQRLLVPASALFGGAFLVLADLAARLLFLPLGTELPVGALTALAGGPLFLLALARERTSGA